MKNVPGNADCGDFVGDRVPLTDPMASVVTREVLSAVSHGH